jgi:AcrR family transcriptional regulator
MPYWPYVHYPNKEAVLFSVFSRFTKDLMQRIAYQGGPWAGNLRAWQDQ